MISQLIDDAVKKAGSQQKLADMIGLKYQNRFGDFKAGRRIPDDETIGQLAEFIGLDPIETILECKLETDKEKAKLWQTWLNKWRPHGDSNPGYRRERAIIHKLYFNNNLTSIFSRLNILKILSIFHLLILRLRFENIPTNNIIDLGTISNNPAFGRTSNKQLQNLS